MFWQNIIHVPVAFTETSQLFGRSSFHPWSVRHRPGEMTNNLFQKNLPDSNAETLTAVVRNCFENSAVIYAPVARCLHRPLSKDCWYRALPKALPYKCATQECFICVPAARHKKNPVLKDRIKVLKNNFDQ